MKIGLVSLALALSACTTVIDADVLIENGTVFTGEDTEETLGSIAIKGDRIVSVSSKDRIRAGRIIDANGLYVLPGFIDPHTHSLSDLLSDDPERRRNDNYLFQGVTTVINGNDGYGPPRTAAHLTKLGELGIGTNTALYIGHGALRRSVMGGEDRAPTQAELDEMIEAVTASMEAGALGLSTGLFYAPGSFSGTEEVIALARAAAAEGGVYDSHIRDESNYSIGLIAAVEEVIQIARDANIPANIAHIKALGVDVWGQSEAIVDLVEQAHEEGLSITADHYPWRASGTSISSALIPRWLKAGTGSEYKARLQDPALYHQIWMETAENLRRRGGADSILITGASSPDIRRDWIGKTLAEIAQTEGADPVDIALQIAKLGDASVASFNMQPDDMKRFMTQDWVMSSSDGSSGHPRKYGSFPKKFRDYVVDEKWISMTDFVHRSTGMVADTFGLCGRGYLREGYLADVIIIDPNDFAPVADFQNPERLSQGVEYVFVNGALAIDEGQATNVLQGRALKRCKGNGENYAE